MMLEHSFGEYVEGLDRVEASSLPLTLRDLKLKEKKIQEDMDEDGSTPFDFKDGKIGSITLKPGWMGSVEVVATNIVLNLAFNPMKAMRRAMGPEDPQGGPPSPQNRDMPPMQMQPPPPRPPRYCANHDTSEKRIKGEPRERECMGCHIKLQTSYTEFSLCPNCSDGQQRCMICGANAPTAGSYVPQGALPTGGQGQDRDAAYKSRAHLPFPEADLPPPPPRGRGPAGGGDRSERSLGGYGGYERGGAPPPPPPPPGGPDRNRSMDMQRPLETQLGYGAPPSPPRGQPYGGGYGPSFQQTGRGAPPGDSSRGQGPPPQGGGYSQRGGPPPPAYNNQDASAWPLHPAGDSGIGAFLNHAQTQASKLFNFGDWSCNARDRAFSSNHEVAFNGEHPPAGQPWMGAPQTQGRQPWQGGA